MRFRWVAAPVATLVLAAACGASPTAAPSSLAPSTPASLQPSPVTVDRGLLTYIPSSVDGVEVLFDGETSTQIAADLATARDVEAIAVSLAATPGSSGAEDLAIVSVVRLREPARNETSFRDWRDTYDEGACGQAGGVIGNAEGELGGRTVFIGSCQGGVHTYHTLLADGAIVVSVTALGSRRLGEKLMAELD